MSCGRYAGSDSAALGSKNYATVVAELLRHGADVHALDREVRPSPSTLPLTHPQSPGTAPAPPFKPCLHPPPSPFTIPLQSPRITPQNHPRTFSTSHNPPSLPPTPRVPQSAPSAPHASVTQNSPED